MSSKKTDPWFPPPELPRTGVESHAHLNHPRYADDLEEVLDRARAAGVAWFGQIFLSPEDYHAQIERFSAWADMFFIVGIHPTDLLEHSLPVLDEIRAIIASNTRIRAVGEIGLDYYWKDCPPDLQMRFFVPQLHMAKDLGLPVVIHCRDAEEDTLKTLMAEGMSGYPLLWHCFGGDPALAGRILDAGWYISLPGTVTFPKNESLRAACAIIPDDRILVETDCPYLAPVPFRGKRNEPANLAYTIATMAQARNTSPQELWTTCGDNARRFFGLEPVHTTSLLPTA